MLRGRYRAFASLARADSGIMLGVLQLEQRWTCFALPVKHWLKKAVSIVDQSLLCVASAFCR